MRTFIIMLVILLSTPSFAQEGPVLNKKSTYAYRWDRAMAENLNIDYDSIVRWKQQVYSTYLGFLDAKENIELNRSRNIQPYSKETVDRYHEDKRAMEAYLKAFVLIEPDDIALHKDGTFSFTTPIPFWIDMNRKALKGKIVIEKLDNLHSKITYKDDLYLTDVLMILSDVFEHIRMHYTKPFKLKA